MEYAGGSLKAEHLCVLVHGLGGRPSDMKNIAKSLREQHSTHELYLLFTEQNSGSLTYDGIDRGGDRVCCEIEQELRTIEEKRGKIRKLSMVGYSLGGLVLRYAIGLLYARGTLQTLDCVNFTTFATPHLGVRKPKEGWHNFLWNTIGARSLAVSGRQLFTIDTFRDTGQPLLVILADPESTFFCGLRLFRRHSLYSNIINDKYAGYCTASIQNVKPYQDLNQLQVRFLEGFGKVILDHGHPVTPGQPETSPACSSSLLRTAINELYRIPSLGTLCILIPAGIATFIINAAIQTTRSYSRIKYAQKSNEKQQSSTFWVQGDKTCNTEHLCKSVDFGSLKTRDWAVQYGQRLVGYWERMVESLDSLEWRRFPVWIHENDHSHGAIIVSVEKSAFHEGHIVLRHFTDEFLG